MCLYILKLIIRFYCFAKLFVLFIQIGVAYVVNASYCIKLMILLLLMSGRTVGLQLSKRVHRVPGCYDDDV